MSSPRKKKSANGKVAGAASEKPAEAIEVTPPIAEVPNLVTARINIVPENTVGDGPRDILDVATMPIDPDEPDDEKKLGGRPLGYTEEIAEQIVAAVQSGLSLREICEKDGLPSRRTVSRWQLRMPEFAERIQQACRRSIMDLEDHALAASRGVGDGEAQKDIAWARLQIETDIEIANRRGADMQKLIGVRDDPENANVIDADFEVVETDDGRFNDALKQWERSTGVQSKAVTVAEAAPAER